MLLQVGGMQAIETLMSEHRVIEHVLDALAGFVEEVRRPVAGEQAQLARFVGFLRDFADEQHHAKEEDILFAAMVRCGFPDRAGPIAVMRDEHERGRVLVRRLGALAALAAPWGDGERADVAEAAQGFARLLRAHIQKEDGVLYPLAEQHLPAAVLAEVEAACAAADAARGERPSRLVALAEDLAARHAPAAITRPA
jgi:hemerythrin-like domain-containing protein